MAKKKVESDSKSVAEINDCLETKALPKKKRRKKAESDVRKEVADVKLEEMKESVDPARVEAPVNRVRSADDVRLRAMAVEYKAHFASLSASEQQYMLYNLMNERLYWRIIYYMRRFPDRLTSSETTYSDRCVGSEEMMRMMGCRPQDMYAEQWLNNHRVPPREVAIERMTLVNAQIKACLDVEGASPIASIKRHFSLSDDELEILGMLVAAMNDEALLRLMTVAWADFTVRLPTVTFVSDVIGDTPEAAERISGYLSEGGTLRKMRLVVAEKHAAFPNYTPLAYTPLSVEQIVIDAYLGKMDIGELPPNMTFHSNALQRRKIIAKDETLEEMSYLLSTSTARLCCVGQPHAGRRTMVCMTAIQNKRKPVLEVDACREFERVASNEIDSRLAEIMREALLIGCVLMLRFDGLEDHIELLHHLVERQTQIARLVTFFPGEIVILATKTQSFYDDAFEKPTMIHVNLPSVEVAAMAWNRALSPWCEREDCERFSEVFSRNYSLPVGSIFGVVRDAVDALQASSEVETHLQSHHILNEIRKSFRHQLGSLAEITVSDVPLSGVVLPAQAKAQVNEILEYAKNLHQVLEGWGFRQRSPYGNALSVLFAGPPGTGKTLLACALANELGKVLYRVDLSRIVDKYIGETEKNLGRIFDEAAKAQAIILFDEADSLFAKRTEVKSSNDRYANLEINFLLQKLESYNGVTILTTNLSKSIDEAFRRRLRFIIDFPMPDVPSRIALWKRMMPPGAPLADDIRWQWLARTFEMSGGYIRNAVLKASISASAAKKPICMEHLVKAAGDEARSMGKLMRIDDNFDYYGEDDVYDDDI
ncbi:MAG: ATP-binding protein [Proteobacteria bacterium]|nr:ATP-binding protein [Pseudomonadota bacterium]